MVKSGLIIIVSTIVFLATTTEALRCWRCSSDATNGAYCSDPFDQTLLDETQRRYGYIECSQNSNTNFQGGINPFNQQNNPYNQNYQVIPACKKLKQLGIPI